MVNSIQDTLIGGGGENSESKININEGTHQGYARPQDSKFPYTKFT